VVVYSSDKGNFNLPNGVQLMREKLKTDDHLFDNLTANHILLVMPHQALANRHGLGAVAKLRWKTYPIRHAINNEAAR